MRDISAVLIGLLPALIFWGLGEAERTAPEFFYAAAAAVAVSLAVYHLLRRWRHPSLLVLLTLGAPLLFYVYVAAEYPEFLFLFYGGCFLVVLAAVLGAVIAGAWSWSEVGGNIAYFCTALLLVIGLARGELAYAEAGLLTAGAFGITRLCQVDCFSWIFRAPRWIYRGLEKLWY